MENTRELQDNEQNLVATAPAAGRPFITRWRGETGKQLRIPIEGKYTLTWYNEATPTERHSEEVEVVRSGDDNRIHNPYCLSLSVGGVYVIEAGPVGVKSIETTGGELAIVDNTGRYWDGENALLEVVQFGDVVWQTMKNAFWRSRGMRFAEGIDVPNLSQVTDMSFMFEDCEHFNSPLEAWDVSHVTAMQSLFYGCEEFNQPLEKWDVSRVTNMQAMFYGCKAFNQPLERWDVSHVTDMWAMFNRCEAFNQPLEAWDVSGVTNMSGMFRDCASFNQPLNGWNVGKVTDMDDMFAGCTSFNQPLDSWHVLRLQHLAQSIREAEGNKE